MSGIQYTVRGISPCLDAKLRREAQSTGKSINALVLETLQQAKLPSSSVSHDDLDWFVGKTALGQDDSDAAQAWLDALPAEPT
jgi:hypothetical protein